MTGYFFLSSMLPPLNLGDKPGLSFQEIWELFRMNMTSGDLRKAHLIRRYVDLKNVWHLLKKQPIDVRGNFTQEELDEALLSREGLPEYLFEYCDSYENVEEQLRHFPKVYTSFFKEVDENERGFLKFYFNFERECRLVLAGRRSRLLGADLIEELQHEDFSDPFVAQIISQRDVNSFEAPSGYEELDERLTEEMDHPKKQYEVMASFRFEKIAQHVQDVVFSINYVLGYFVQFMIVEDWNIINEMPKSHGITEVVESAL